MKAIINANVYDFQSYKEDCYILFDKTIVEVGPMNAFSDTADEVIDAYGHLVMPSLVNAHGHIYSTFARGMSVPFNPKDFEDVLKQLWWKLDSALDNKATYYSGLVHSIDSAKNGITTIIDHHASGREISGSLSSLRRAVCDEVGLRGVFCFETSDRFDVEACIKENIDFYKVHKQNSKTAALFGLHASMTLSDDTLMKVNRVVTEHKLPIHIHVAESSLDNDWCLEQYNMTVIQRLNRFGLLLPGSLLVHCIHINEADAAIIKEKGCYVALNVTSNMNNGVGMPNYNLLEEAGIPVVIGNDGLSSAITNEWLNLNYASHHLEANIMATTIEDIRQAINHGYDHASTLLGCKLGRIEPGYEADLLMLSYTPPTPMTDDNAFGHVFYGMAHSFKPKHVWCCGEQIVFDYQVCKVLDYKYKEAVEIARNVWERM